MKKYAVIVAGGSGLRMGTATPKQFLLLNGKPVLWHTINAFISTYIDINIILVLPKEHIEKGAAICGVFTQQIDIVVGGVTRFDSVKNGLKLIKEEAVVFVHDGVRCLISKDLIERCYNQTVEIGSAIPAIAAIDSIRIVDNNEHQFVNRNNVKIIQTPQTFLSSILLPAFEQNYNESFTDEATVVEAFGIKIFLCEGDYNNIKITRPIDLLIAESILNTIIL